MRQVAQRFGVALATVHRIFFQPTGECGHLAI